LQPIKKLNIQLANQIAAGEVVERPASVVKELLENSLDAGAQRVDIEITAGGTNLIRIRDDGSGIPKEQLALALAPHATSKIDSLDDLDSIISFGFRGEALASISSVSRFTLSSKTKQANQGWQAEAEGSDMDVKLTPVAVTEGTRIDVRELFFNTPARRRFLRTEKTEFSHIEDVVKKAALANFKVAITLKHNARMVRRFRAANTLAQEEQRVAAVCGREFMQRSVRLELSHQGLEIQGWLALPDYHRSQTDGQYFYVNNRPVKDRVLSHAIRQAYQSFIPEGRVPAYVLYLTLDPRKVDVNVHPTKHEVRFHDARLIHDLLVQSIERGLAEGKELIDNETLQVRDAVEFAQAPSRQSSYSGQSEKQRQDYRSLLQSVSSSEAIQGVKEFEQGAFSESYREVDGWRYLTRLDSNHCLLEKNKQLVLLSIGLLINKIKQQKTASEIDQVKSIKLLFPEIINCFDKAEAKHISELLEQKSLVTSVFEKQVTLLEIPSWMDEMPLKELSLEFAISVSDKLVSTHLTFQEITHLMSSLLAQCDDFSGLNLKQMSRESLTTLFTEPFAEAIPRGSKFES